MDRSARIAELPLEAGAAFCTNCGAKAAQPEQPDLGGGIP